MKLFSNTNNTYDCLFQLVSHEIEAGGKAFSGGKSVNGPTATGLHFEITLLQVYSVALSAGMMRFMIVSSLHN
jgi:hypothetical protein